RECPAPPLAAFIPSTAHTHTHTHPHTHTHTPPAVFVSIPSPILATHDTHIAPSSLLCENTPTLTHAFSLRPFSIWMHIQIYVLIPSLTHTCTLCCAYTHTHTHTRTHTLTHSLTHTSLIQSPSYTSLTHPLIHHTHTHTHTVQTCHTFHTESTSHSHIYLTHCREN